MSNDFDLDSLFAAILDCERWYVAYSGGCDSTVLLDLAQRANQRFQRHPDQLQALHINHQLQAESTAWASHCRLFCEQRDISFETMSVDVVSNGRGIEDAARQARYTIFEKMVNADSVILLGHHSDDQIETLMLRLCRGTGINGMTAIPRERPLGRGRLFRPLLHVSRFDLTRYAKSRSLKFIEDPSNNDVRYDRNYLRAKVLPELCQRWPNFNDAMLRFREHCEDASELLNTLANEDVKKFFTIGVAGDARAEIASLRACSEARLRNTLHYFFREQQAVILASSEMNAVLAWIYDEASAQQRMDLPALSLRIFRGTFYSLPSASLGDLAPNNKTQCIPEVEAPAAWLLPWQRCFLVVDADSLQTTKPGLKPGRYRLGVRQEGASCRIRGSTRTLKKLLNEIGVPPWWRDAYPILYNAESGELVAVGDRWISDEARIDVGKRWILSIEERD